MWGAIGGKLYTQKGEWVLGDQSGKSLWMISTDFLAAFQDYHPTICTFPTLEIEGIRTHSRNCRMTKYGRRPATLEVVHKLGRGLARLK